MFFSPFKFTYIFTSANKGKGALSIRPTIFCTSRILVAICKRMDSLIESFTVFEFSDKLIPINKIKCAYAMLFTI